MTTDGYYRYPTIHKDTIVFVSEDDLWSVDSGGGVARRLTSSPGNIASPFFSPDGQTLAFTGRDEGHSEVYTMPASGGSLTRLTYLGVSTNVIGWEPDGKSILFSSDHEQPIDRIGVVYSISPEGGLPVRLPIGPAVSISVAAGNRVVIGRNNNDPARWKRYKGGTAGDIWVDTDGNGEFSRLVDIHGNVGRPMWLGERIYFLSDHEGIGNLYSVKPDGTDMIKHTDHADYYVRYPSTDGRRIVYHAGADLWVYDPFDNSRLKVEVAYHSSLPQRQRRFVDAARYLESYALSPKGESLAITSRGKLFTFGNWDGAVLESAVGSSQPGRYRLAEWLNDGKRIVAVSDTSGEDALEVHTSGSIDPPVRLLGLDIGKPSRLRVSPTSDQVALSNHRFELIIVDLTTSVVTVVDKSIHSGIGGFDWSPDGRWLAYGFSETKYTQGIKLWDSTTGESTPATRPMLADYAPEFDPEGKYLYFIGQRELNPVYDALRFDLGFPRGSRPYLITLTADTGSPFQTPAEAPQKPTEKETAPGDTASDETGKAAADAGVKAAVKPVEIDLEGITERVLAFPVPEGRYHRIVGLHGNGKVLFTSSPIEGALRKTTGEEHTGAQSNLELYDFKERKHEVIAHRISDFDLSQDTKTVLLRSSNKLRVVPAGAKLDEKAGAEPGKRSGWIDTSRIRVSIDPVLEWEQMARDAWRLQRDHFWTENMSGVDWVAVWNRYYPLIARVGTRGEFSDLMWEMQGELGTSHAYESGGDYRVEPTYPQGFLGADLSFDAATELYRVDRVLTGDAGIARASSPLLAPGVNVKAGDALIAINGKRLTREWSPYQALTYHAGQEISIIVRPAGELDSADAQREVTVTTLRSETQLRYRDWVEANRKLVHEATGGRVGYVHIPDMGANGYAEFHRLYLTEVDRDGLIVDVRFNRGGHVSQLLLEKLNRKRVGYCVARWGQPEPYPTSSVAGPIVALTNQFAGSDGDIFSHVFKLLDLGTLIGKRTWGGVIGISPRYPLVDGTVTTQPEYSFWFRDVGWGVENYGTDPHIDIDIAPQDFARGYDPQMEKALEVVLQKLEENPIFKPAFDSRPSLALPWHSEDEPAQ